MGTRISSTLGRKGQAEISSQLLNQKQVAAILGKHRETVRRWVKLGLLPEPCCRHGKAVYWSQLQVDAIAGKQQKELTA